LAARATALVQAGQVAAARAAVAALVVTDRLAALVSDQAAQAQAAQGQTAICHRMFV